MFTMNFIRKASSQ